MWRPRLRRDDDMQFSKQDCQRIMQLWGQHETLLLKILDQQIANYTEQLGRQTTEWETLRQGIEFIAKKQALIDLKKVLSEDYANSAHGE